LAAARVLVQRMICVSYSCHPSPDPAANRSPGTQPSLRDSRVKQLWKDTLVVETPHLAVRTRSSCLKRQMLAAGATTVLYLELHPRRWLRMPSHCSWTILLSSGSGRLEMIVTKAYISRTTHTHLQSRKVHKNTQRISGSDAGTVLVLAAWHTRILGVSQDQCGLAPFYHAAGPLSEDIRAGLVVSRRWM
jgi:hypothetical protein